MRTAFKLACAFIWRDKKQTLALLAGIVLASALFTGIGSLFSSGLEAAKENAKIQYGNWHYEIRADLPWFQSFLDDPEGEGFKLQAYGVETVCKTINVPFDIQFVSADSGYLEMMGRSLLQGRMPEAANEIAMDAHTLQNLGVDIKLGTNIQLDGQTFVLTGLVAEMPEQLPTLLGEFMQVFVSPDLDYGKNGSFVYLQFDESQDCDEQMKAFCRQYDIDESQMARNNGLASYVGTGEKITLEEIFHALRDPVLGVPYVWGSLNENQAMTESAVLIALALFSAFIIYSIFQVSVLKRMRQYSIMQTLGLTDGGILRVLFCELSLVFAIGYTCGGALGNAIAAFIYSQSGRIFIARDTEVHTGIGADVNAAALSVTNLPDAGSFHINEELFIIGGIFLIGLLIVISFVLMRRMRRLSLQEIMTQNENKHRSRRIMSLEKHNLTGVMTKRFMFAHKSTFVSVVFSLAIGSVIFLGASYIIINTHINNTLVFAADDGLGSEIELTQENGLLQETIPKQTIDALRNIDGVASVMPVSYMLGELSLENGALRATSYYPEIAHEEGWEQDPIIMERYGGIVVQCGEDDYRLKVNIYGYDDDMLAQLDEYLLDGSIDPDVMRENDTIIYKPLMDGQGNYDSIDIELGDMLTLKTPVDPQADDAVLHFQSEENAYKELPLAVGAIVARPLGKVNTTIGDDGQSTVDIIMTQEQMQKHFGVSGYQTVSISLSQTADGQAVVNEIRDKTIGITGCIVHDYASQIAAQDAYLKQQMIFFYGIALVLLLTSLLHLVNSMNFLVAERRHEFAIIRAMGITKSGFIKMLAMEGLRYGVYAGLVSFIFYMIVQKILYYMLLHAYLYLQPEPQLSFVVIAGVLALNIILCVLAMIWSARKLSNSGA